MNVHFSSKTNEWTTPIDFYNKLNNEFNFTLDPCCTNDDGLSKDWSNEIVFMNPPYGREIKHWIKKAHDESLKGALVVCLIPARTDTAYWHDYCMKGTIRFIRGRLKFSEKNSAPFPSAVVIFGDKK